MADDLQLDTELDDRPADVVEPLETISWSNWQGKLLNDVTSDVVIVTAGYGTGKTFGLAAWCVDRLAYNPGCDGLFIEPQYSLIKRVAIPAFREVLGLLGYKERLHYTIYTALDNPRIEFISGQTIFFLSGERPDSIVGITTAAFAALDEAALCQEEVLLRCRARCRYKKAKKCQVALGTTTEGLGWLSDRFDSDANPGWKKLDPEGKDAILVKETVEPNGNKTTHVYRRIRATTYSNKTNLSPDYIANLFDTWGFSEDYIASYVYGFFRPFTKGRAYSNYKQAVHRIPNIDPKPNEPIFLSWDFNICPQWVSIQEGKRSQPGRKDARIYNVIHNADAGHEQLEDAVIEFALKHPRATFKNTPIYLHGDPSGRSRSHKVSGSDFKNIKTLLHKLGYTRVEIAGIQTSPLERVSVDTVQFAFTENVLFICERCTKVINSIVRTCWKNGEKQSLDKPPGDTWTHPMDAVKYFMYAVVGNVRQLVTGRA